MNMQNAHFDALKKCNYTVALIDADETINHQIADRLRTAGCKVLQAFGSDEILAVLSHSPDFIVIDPIYESYDEFKLCDYLSNADAAGIAIFSSDTNLQRREYLFSCGILEYFSKEEPIEYVVDELLHLFETIQTNTHYHVTIISSSHFSQQKFQQLILHRKYQLCFFTQIEPAKDKWKQYDHELPDLLILDLKTGCDIHEIVELIRYIRLHKILEMPIVMLFDTNEPDLFSKLYRMGVNTILSEPYSSEQLLSTITRNLDYRISKKRLKYEQNLSYQLKAMIDSSSIVSKTNPVGIITYVNPEFCRITGYTEQELIGKPHSIVRHPDMPKASFEQIWKTIQSKKIFHGIIMNRRKDGSTYYVDSTIAPLLDEDGSIIEYISIRHDVTSLIERQYEIEAQRRQIQNVLDAQTSLICLVDKAKGVLQANLGFMKFLGISSLNHEISGFHCLHELFLDIDSALQIEHGERYLWLDHLYEMRGNFVKVAMKDSFYNHHIFSIHVEKIADTRFTDDTCYLVTFDDVTELSRALREAKAASEAESRFLATMSHEIRTPLNGILGFTELLLETTLDKEQKKYLQAIEYSGETLRQIINDILDVMKLDQERLELNNETIDLIGELEAIVYPFYAQAAKKGVDLLVFIDPKLPMRVDTDILHFKQILINLISNAIKFTPTGKHVHIRIKKLRASNGKVTVGFTVADEGIGVKPEYKEAIFRAFVQADNSIAREYGGTGLGLNIVQRMVTAMGGRIAFKSTVGKGSIFHTSLEFISDSLPHPYSIQKKRIHLYLPVLTPSARFNLAERYLKHFECYDPKKGNIDRLDELEDHRDLMVVLFADALSIAEITAAAQRFQMAKLFIIPSSLSDTALLPVMNKNIFWISAEITWSTLAKGMDIYHHSYRAQQQHEKSAAFKDLRILVAEDNDVNQFYIQELLNKLQITYELAHDGYETVKKFINGKYDLVLMDINMPNLDGITAARQILRYEQETGAAHTPIIGLSADAVAKNINDYLQKGLDGYLIKPLRKGDLVKTLQELFPLHAEPSPLFETVPEPKIYPDEETEKSILTYVASKLELPETVILKLFHKFIGNAQTILEQIDSSQDDLPQLKMAIHSLKGIAKNLYLEPLGEECERFEAERATLSADQKLQRLNVIRHEIKKTIHRMNMELIS